MIERNLAERFKGKRIVFCWKNNNREIFSNGLLKDVTDNSLIIEFKGVQQVYDLNSIISIRELPGEISLRERGRKLE